MNAGKIVLTKMEQIAINARRLPNVSFTSLAYHLKPSWLYDAYRTIRRDGAIGVDDVTAEKFEENLQDNLKRLVDEAKSGRYRAPAVKRVYIDKINSNEKRPLGIPTFADKVLQKAVKWILEPIYEVDFYDCSYGFRPGRSQHQALHALWNGLMEMGGAWIIDLDIRKFFDTIKWPILSEVIKQRVCDGVIIRLIGKWMNAGVMEEGSIYYPLAGTPQGGVISPLLANIFLHEVLDKWFHQTVLPLLKEKAFEIRFADDALLCFKNKEDALRVMKVLPKRLEKYGLQMHPEKTKLLCFTRPKGSSGYKNGERSDTFDYLGFTHYWRKSRKGNPVVGRKTASKRLTNSLLKIKKWLRYNMHANIAEVHKMLVIKIKGHFNYFGISSNISSLSKFKQNIERVWRKMLNRRGAKHGLNWQEMKEKILKRYPLPMPYILHSNV